MSKLPSDVAVRPGIRAIVGRDPGARLYYWKLEVLPPKPPGFRAPGWRPKEYQINVPAASDAMASAFAALMKEVGDE